MCWKKLFGIHWMCRRCDSTGYPICSWNAFFQNLPCRVQELSSYPLSKDLFRMLTLHFKVFQKKVLDCWEIRQQATIEWTCSKLQIQHVHAEQFFFHIALNIFFPWACQCVIWHIAFVLNALSTFLVGLLPHLGVRPLSTKFAPLLLGVLSRVAARRRRHGAARSSKGAQVYCDFNVYEVVRPVYVALGYRSPSSMFIFSPAP